MTKHEHTSKHILLKARENLEATPFSSVRSIL